MSKIKAFKEIFNNNCSLNGWGYRVTSNGVVCHIQEDYQGSRWRTVRTVASAEFDQFVDDEALDDPYRQNPIKLARFARLGKWGEDECEDDDPPFRMTRLHRRLCRESI